MSKLAFQLASLIMTDLMDNYRDTPTGDLMDTENSGYSDIDEFIHDIIKEYDASNNNILSKMKTGAFETDGTDKVRDIIYQGFARYCDRVDNAELVYKNDEGKVNFRDFTQTLEQIKDKNGSFYDKLKNLIKDYI